MTTIHRDGQNYGPYDPEKIQELIKSGNISVEDMAWREGESDWRPLKYLFDGLETPRLPPPISATKSKAYEEYGVYIGVDRVSLGSTTFATKNIGGVSVQIEQRRIFWAGLAFLFGLIFALGTIVGAFSPPPGQDRAVAVMMFIVIAMPLIIWGGNRLFSARKISLLVAASGGLQKALESTDRKRIERLAAEIKRVIS